MAEGTSPMSLPQSSSGRFEVIIVDRVSYRRIMGYKQLWILKSYLDGAEQVASARKVG